MQGSSDRARRHRNAVRDRLGANGRYSGQFCNRCAFAGQAGEEPNAVVWDSDAPVGASAAEGVGEACCAIVEQKARNSKAATHRTR